MTEVRHRRATTDAAALGRATDEVASATDRLDKATDAIREAIAVPAEAKPNGAGREDPAMQPAALPTERAYRIVHEIAQSTRHELSRLRDEIDDLLRSVEQREQALGDQIGQFADFAAQAIEAKLIITENVQRLRKQFETATPALSVGRTISSTSA